LAREFVDEDVSQFKVCAICWLSLNKQQIPALSRSNEFVYPPYPTDLPPLDCITERLISARLPFMQIRRLRHQMGGFGLVELVTIVPVDVNNMVTLLPRELDDDFSFNVHIKRNLIHKSTYLEGIVKKDTIKLWLAYLINTPLYRHYNITINDSFFHRQQTIEEENIQWIYSIL
jgi:hypothetical protein